MTELKLLTNGALHMVDREFIKGNKELDSTKLSKYVEQPDFSIEIDSLLDKVDEVMEKHGSSKKSVIDKKLASTVHKELDLTRRQASNPEIWNYLSIYERPEFVRYRWNKQDGEKVAKNRYIVRSSSKQSLNRQAFSSLWWVAELTYSEEVGYDYTEKVFDSQEFKNWIMGPSYSRKDEVVRAMLRELHGVQDEKLREILPGLTERTSTYSIDAMNEKELRGLIGGLHDFNDKDADFMTKIKNLV
jgi:hypothetical protein